MKIYLNSFSQAVIFQATMPNGINILNYLEFLEPMQQQFTRIYSTMSGVIALLLVLWVINLIVGLIQRTYSTGRAFGSFYRNYLHSYLKALVIQILSIVKRDRSETAT